MASTIITVYDASLDLTTTPVIDDSGSQTASISQELSVLAVSDNTDIARVSISKDTDIVGNSMWNGTLDLPEATSTDITPPADSGNTASVVSAVYLGSLQTPLALSIPVQLVFFDQAGNDVGWTQNGGSLTPITTVCNENDEVVVNLQLAAGGDCYYTDGSDLVVWTKHFTTFITYKQTAIPAPAPTPAPVSSGGGGGGGIVGGSLSVGYTNASSTAGTGTGSTGGQELGAAAYNFTKNLTIGSTGTDVTALQNLLIADGYLTAAPTGYFGGLTQAAVKKFQAAHKISPQSGYVGALTRVALNMGTTPSTPETSTGSTGSGSSLTSAQVQAILGLLQSFGADASTIANVTAALGK